MIHKVWFHKCFGSELVNYMNSQLLYMQNLQACTCEMGNCTCNGPPSHISLCIFCGCHSDSRAVFSHFTLPLSDVFSCPNNFSKYKNVYINNNFSKLPIVDEGVCLGFPSPPFHVILQRRYVNDVAVCDITCFFRNKFNVVTLFYKQIGDWSI